MGKPIRVELLVFAVKRAKNEGKRAIEFSRVFASFSTAKTEVMPRDSMIVYNFSSLLENFRYFHVLLSFFLSLGQKKPRFFQSK